MEFKVIVGFLWLNTIRLCYQQDIAVCEIGSVAINGVCVKQTCESTHQLINGACHPKPTSSPCGAGYGIVNGGCTQLICPNNYFLEKGVCRPNAVYPSYSSTTPTPSVYCPNGYILYNRMCYHNTVTVPSPCQQKQCGIFNCPTACTPVQYETTTVPTTITTTTTTTTTTTPLPPPAQILLQDCPSNSVLIDGKCRLIYCPKGTVHNGRCLEPVCTDGLVWTGYTCSKPEVITTILEIENKYITEFNQTGPNFLQPKVTSNISYHTEAYETSTDEEDCSTTTTTTTTTTEVPGEIKKCCTIYTPRVCKRYPSKWLCSSKQYKRCDSICGNSTRIYLRIPKVIDHPPFVVMPPNPPLQVCADDNCNANDLHDCSGCAKNQREGCSSYCYSYYCPKNRCRFIDQLDYCTTYPGSQGCTSDDGCFGEWCS